MAKEAQVQFYLFFFRLIGLSVNNSYVTSPKRGTKTFERIKKAPKCWMLLRLVKRSLTPLVAVEHLIFGPGSHKKRNKIKIVRRKKTKPLG